jgi:hypothetical protein
VVIANDAILVPVTIVIALSIVVSTISIGACTDAQRQNQSQA